MLPDLGKRLVSTCKSLYLLGFSPASALTWKAGIRYAGPVRIIKNRRGASASSAARHLPRFVGTLMISAALLAPVGAALAAPQAVRQPAMRPVDDQGLLDSVANRSSRLITQVRDGASG